VHKLGWIRVDPTGTAHINQVGPTKKACINLVGLGLGRLKKSGWIRVDLTETAQVGPTKKACINRVGLGLGLLPSDQFNI